MPNPAIPAIPAAPIILSFVPEPLQVRITTWGRGEDRVGAYQMIWRADEAERCRLCSRAKCNREPVPETDTTSCFRLLSGEASDRFAAALGVGL